MKAQVQAIAVAVLLLGAAVPASVAAGTAQGKAYSQSYVSFETKDKAVVNYAVNDKVVVESVKMQSAAKARSSAGVSVDADLKAITHFTGATLSVSSTAKTQAVVKAESGATFTANDNDRGIFVVEAGGSKQLVRANLSSGSEVTQVSDSRVVVTGEGGTKAVFIATGDGKVTVNDGNNVTARISGEEELVYRQYNGKRSESDKQQEQLIASGKAVAEVYVQQGSETGSDAKANVVKYGEDTTVTVTETSESTVKMTADSASEGKVIITCLSQSAFQNAQNAQVKVDGNAATKVESYSKVAAVTKSGVRESRYTIRSSSSAQASTDVVVGVGHFSKRTVTMTSGDGSGDGGGDGNTPTGTDGSGPGFGVLAALSALGAALLARARL